MSRSSTLRASIACLAILPAFTACSMLPGGEKVEATPSQNQAAPQESNTDPSTDENQQADNEQSPEASDEPGDDESQRDESQNDDADSSASESEEGTTGESGSTEGVDGSGEENESGSNNSASPAQKDGNGTSRRTAPAPQRIAVPASSGISSLELIDIQGAPTQGGQHGRIAAAFKATTDQPLMLNIRIDLLDANGKVIATNTGLTSSYAVGTHDLVTSNLIKLPSGVKPKRFKATLIKTTKMNPNFSISKVSKPQVGTSSKSRGVPALTGTVTLDGTMKGSVTAHAACITPDGRVYHGSESLNDNPVKGGSVDYEIPIYDAKGVDLSTSRCYASA
ncbi:hypothetical protein AAEX63_14075 [Luteococcus sp. H138]|uniref:hypothetical protein n=1 Tax=unclassified Luteococcus TaxID=2639923 RepID=UPI00313D6A3E